MNTPQRRPVPGAGVTGRNPFDDLFVLELANNHLGRLDRGLRIIKEHAKVVRYNGVRAAIKLQFRDVDAFVHKNFRHREDIRYVKKTLDTKMSKADYAALVKAVRDVGCVTMATPFDEASVDLCVELGVQIIKIASSDVNDWFLIEKIAETRRPAVISTGGSTLKDVDDVVTFFENRNIPLAVNHCVSIYPCEDNELDLNQIDFLRGRYPGHVVGLSTHEYQNWEASMLVAYAKGARTFERHIDVDADGVAVAAYNSLPHQVDTWFKAYKKAKEMCGNSGDVKRIPPAKEIAYLDALVRGVYARRDLPEGHVFMHEHINDDVYLAIPLQKGQISCRELMSGEALLRPIRKDEPVMVDAIDSPYGHDESLRRLIMNRGL